jgi:hypothetical protein
MQSWAMERLVHEHRRDLAGITGVRAETVNEQAVHDAHTTPDFLVSWTEAQPQPQRASERRGATPHLGDWLIRAGIRLGGASMHISQS